MHAPVSVRLLLTGLRPYLAGEWFCPACVRAGNADAAGQQPASAADEPHPAVQRSEFQRAAELLGTTEYVDLTPVCF